MQSMTPIDPMIYMIDNPSKKNVLYFTDLNAAIVVVYEISFISTLSVIIILDDRVLQE